MSQTIPSVGVRLSQSIRITSLSVLKSPALVPAAAGVEVFRDRPIPKAARLDEWCESVRELLALTLISSHLILNCICFVKLQH